MDLFFLGFWGRTPENWYVYISNTYNFKYKFNFQNCSRNPNYICIINLVSLEYYNRTFRINHFSKTFYAWQWAPLGPQLQLQRRWGNQDAMLFTLHTPTQPPPPPDTHTHKARGTLFAHYSVNVPHCRM